MASSSATSDNPGHVLASAVDAEVAKFRQLQVELDKIQTDLQVVMSQETETELVASELKISSNNHASSNADTIYKLIGPVLIQQDIDEAIQTIQKRLEYIRGEKDKLSNQLNNKEQQSHKLATKIQTMQSQLQQTTAAAVRAIADQHHQQSS